MKISQNWLETITGPLPSVAEVSDLLTFAGIEVEGIESSGVSIPNIVVARIDSFEKHPDADRLSVCQVDDGSGQARQIVCGAKNFKAGDHVPLALPGAVLPGDFKIKVGKLRGVKSEGMMCSGRELGIGTDHEGLLLLDRATKPGTPLSEIFPGDTVYELEITPNRPDLLSVNGIARELCTLLGREPKFILGDVEIFTTKTSGKKATPAKVTVSVGHPRGCPLYTAARISGVKVGPSPEWLRTRLEASGLRSINNLVDITNFVLLETGQPLHAFDAAKIKGSIHVRLATAGEQFAALDGTTHKLSEEDLVIADDSSVLALAGVMGGADSGVTESTTDIVLESAWFEPSMIRRTARRHGFSTDSSYRFERGVDVSGIEPAAARAATLIVEIAAGQLLLPTAHVEDKTHSAPLRAGAEISLRHERCLALLGYPVALDEVRTWLSGIGLEEILVGQKSENVTKWKIPTRRNDLRREVDLIEEICRLAGMDRIVGRASGIYAPAGEPDHLHDFKLATARRLAAAGFSEARTLALISADQKADCVLEPCDALNLKNPMSEDHAFLRPSLVPTLLAVVSHNTRQGSAGVRLFEIGTVFDCDGRETEKLAIVAGGVTERRFRQSGGQPLDFSEIKTALAALGLEHVELKREPSDILPLRVVVLLAGERIGLAGALPGTRTRALGIRGSLFLCDLDFAAVRAATGAPRRFEPMDRFPAMTRDIALVAPLEFEAAEVNRIVKETAEPLLRSVEIFDQFVDPKGEKLPIDRKSLAFTLTYRAPDRTLTEAEVTAAHTAIVAKLTGSLPVQIRQ